MERRKFITSSSLTVLSVSIFGSLSWNGRSFEGDSPTTTDILGPFYRPGAPMRTNLRLPGSNGMPIILKGSIFKEDGKTPINNAFVEIWHCDEHEVYDNVSDEYKYRGAQKTNPDGKYVFNTIMPVPYRGNPTDESTWRPAHIHMRVSVPDQQDLVTQIYFSGGKYLDTDSSASSPRAVNRILNVKTNSARESEIIFNVVMRKEIPLDKKAYDMLVGLYNMGENIFFEFIKSDDQLMMKQNGQLRASLSYIGNNTFEGGIGYPKASFEILGGGGVKVTIVNRTKTYTGTKFLKYNG